MGDMSDNKDIQILFEEALSKAVDSNSKILVNILISNIIDLSNTLKDTASKLSSDTHSKMEIYRDSRITLLKLYIDGTLTEKDLNGKVTSNDIAIIQTDRRRFISCSQNLLFFEDDHPIKEIFMDVINFQGIVKNTSYQYSQILTNFKKNLELMPKVTLKQIDIDPEYLIGTDILKGIITKFVEQEDIYRAFIDLQNDIYNLTGKKVAGTNDTIDIYYQIACIGVNDPNFLFKFLTTSEGIDPYEQDKFINITYIKTSILPMMQMI